MCGSRDLAEDLVQETYAKVLSRPRLLRRDDDLGYLVNALRNTWYSHLRDERTRRASTDLREQVPENLAARTSEGTRSPRWRRERCSMPSPGSRGPSGRPSLPSMSRA
jgi:DNA-directed RNA polymerase specialized sigma24 family protein